MQNQKMLQPTLGGLTTLFSPSTNNLTRSSRWSIVTMDLSGTMWTVSDSFSAKISNFACSASWRRVIGIQHGIEEGKERGERKQRMTNHSDQMRP